MNIIKQIAIIIGCLAFGECIVYFSTLPLPSSIIGLILLWSLLQTKLVKIEDMKDVAQFLLKNMGIFFVPPCVAMLNYFNIIKTSFVQLIVIILVSTLLVILATAFTHQLLRKNKK